MVQNLVKDAKFIRHENAVAAGTTLITPTNGVDTAGFDNCCFVVALGAIVAGAVTSIKVQQSDDDGSSDTYDDLAGSAQTIADTDDNKLFLVDIKRPAKRWLKLLVSRGTQNATLDGIVAVLYNGTTCPVTHDATTVGGSEVHHTPAEGTA